MSEMIDLTPRDYEVSVWTLQDSYKATLKWSGIDHQGLIMAPKMSISDDGTETFSFSIPMYLNVKKGNLVVKAENPMWYIVKDNELLLQNMRKIKVILDKGKADREKVYEFIIVKVKDSHEDDKLLCDVECEGLAFHELGKLGFKIELSSEVFYDRLKKYTEGKKWYDNNYIEHSDEPVETIAYWMNDLDILPVASASSRFVSKWYYDVRMRYDNSGTISNKIMEDAYISAWNDDLSPKTVEPRAEKKRLIDAKESNKYNLTQTIAEKFGVFCRYEYTHDANYCITGRTVVFYNDFLRDENGFSELTYPHSSLKIEREHDATDITTKMFVRPEEDTSSLTGQISIIDTEANMTKEDYIMNFDYFHLIKTISDDLYNALTSYNLQIHDINCGNGQLEGLISLLEQLIAKKERKIEVEAQLKVVENSANEAERRLNDVSEKIKGVVDLDLVVPITLPKKHMVLTDNNGVNYINLSTAANQEIKFDTIRIYRNWNSLAAAANGATEADAFPEILTTTFPKASSLVFDASAALTKTAIRLYRKVYKHKNGREITYDDARINILACFTAVNSSTNIRLPSMYFGNDSSFDESILGSGNGNLNYNILQDDVGWVLAAMGYATIEKISATSNNYAITKIKLWGSNASSSKLLFDSNNKITKESWNELITYRKNWILAVTANVNRSEITTTGADAATIIYDNTSGKWLKTDTAGTTVLVSVVSYSDENNKTKYRVNWGYHYDENKVLSGASLKGIWSGTTNLVSNKSVWQDENGLNVPSYYNMLEKFGLTVIHNKVTAFSAKRNSDNSLIALVDLPDEVKGLAVYLLYTWNPKLYWEQILTIWTKKSISAQTEWTYYKNELNALETAITNLETNINQLLKQKHQIIELFNSLMGPALRESYWQPEDYHNYGDLYLPNPFEFSYDYTEQLALENDTAALIWDIKYFSGEQKITYGYSVENTPYYYECISLNSIPKEKKANLYSHLNELVFSFYDDGFGHKDENGDEIKQIYLYEDNGPWYYVLSYGTTADGDYIKKVLIERKEASRKYYRINSDMFLGFVKAVLSEVVENEPNENQTNYNKITPVLILTGLNELPDDTIDFIMLKFSLIRKSNKIHPGALPSLGYFDSEGKFVSLCDVLPKNWCLSRNNNVFFTEDEEEEEDETINEEEYTLPQQTYLAVYPRFEIKTLQLKNVYTTLIGVVDDSTNIVLEEYKDFTIFNRDKSHFITIKPEAFINKRTIIVDKEEEETSVNLEVETEEIEEPEEISFNLFEKDYLGRLKQQGKTPLKFKLTYMISNGGTYIYLDALKVLKENSIPKVAYTVLPNLNNQGYRKYDLGQIVMINDYELKLHNVFGYISQITMDLDHYWQDEITVKDYKNKFEDLFSTITAQVEEMKKNSGIISGISAGILPMGLASSILDLEDGTTQYRLSSIIDAYLDSHFDGREVVELELNEIFKEAADILSDGSLALTELGALNEENANILSTLLSLAAEARDIKVFYVETDDPNDGSVTGYNVGDICITPSGSRYTAIAEPENTTSTHFMPTYDGNVSKITGASMEIDADKGYIDLKAENEINIASGKNLYIAAGSDISMVGNKVVNIAGPTINICSTSERVLTLNGNDFSYETLPVLGGVNIIALVYDLENPTDTTQSGVYIKYNLIEMISADIKMTAVNDNDSTKGSTMYISGTDGIWLGTNNGAGIRMYAAPTQNDNSNITGITANLVEPFTSGSSLEILPNKIFFGTLLNKTDENSNYGSTMYMDPDKFIIATGNADSYINKDFSDSTGLVGAKFTKNSIGFATYTNNIFNAVLMNDNGISMASGEGANITNITDLAATETNGSFLRLSPKGIRMGTTADLYINADNFKLLTNAAPVETGTLGLTVFAIGTHLNGITSNTTVSDLKGNSTVRFLINLHCAYINGAIHATADSEIAGFYVGTLHFSSILSSGSRRDSIDSEIKGVYIGTNGISITDNRDPNYFYRIVTFWLLAWVELYDLNKDTIYAELKQSLSFTSSLANTVNAWNTWWTSVHAPTEEIPASNSELYLELAWTLQDLWRAVLNDLNWKATFWDVTEYSVLVNIIKAVLLYSRSTTETTSDYGRVLFKIDVNRSLLLFGGDINGNNSLLKVDATKDVIDINGITNVLTAINIGKDFSNDGDNDISTTDFNIYSGYFRLINKLDSSSDRWYIRLGLRVDREGTIKDPTPLGYANKIDLGDNHYTYDVVYLCTYSIKLIARGWIHGDGASKTLATFSHSGSLIKATLENTTTAPSGVNFGEMSMDTIIWSGTTQVE